MLSKAELLDLYNMDLDKLLNESKKYLKEEVEFCSIISARTGKCSQNCKYCAQSSHYNTNIETNPLMKVQEVVDAALDSVKNGADRIVNGVNIQTKYCRSGSACVAECFEDNKFTVEDTKSVKLIYSVI